MFSVIDVTSLNVILYSNLCTLLGSIAKQGNITCTKVTLC